MAEVEDQDAIFDGGFGKADAVVEFEFGGFYKGVCADPDAMACGGGVNGDRVWHDRACGPQADRLGLFVV